MVLTARWHLLRWHILLHFSGDLLSCHSAALHAFSVEVSQRPPFLLAAPVMWSRLHPWFRSKPCFSGLTEPVLCIPRGRGCCSGMSTESSRTQEGATGSGRGCWFKVSHFSLLDVSPEKWGSGSDFHTWGERLTEKGASFQRELRDVVKWHQLDAGSNCSWSWYIHEPFKAHAPGSGWATFFFFKKL